MQELIGRISSFTLLRRGSCRLASPRPTMLPGDLPPQLRGVSPRFQKPGEPRR